MDSKPRRRRYLWILVPCLGLALILIAGGLWIAGGSMIIPMLLAGGDYEHALTVVAQKGNADAQCQLGADYYSGADELKKDPAAGVPWLRKAADQGAVCGLYNLGVAYQEGNGVPKNMPEAIRLWQEAADKGFVHAQYNLAVVYRDGVGVKKDKAQAIHWFQLAADQGDDESQDQLKALQGK
ncbi:MAG: tetratricopeptide repeat protein [Alphaproteobacteria bacterium]